MDFRDLLKQMSGKPDSNEIIEENIEEELPVKVEEYSLEQASIERGNLVLDSIPEKRFNNILKTEISSTFNNINNNVLPSSKAVIDNNFVIPTKEQDFFAPPNTIKETGLSVTSLQDLLLKCLFYQSNSTGKELAQKLRLPLHSIIDPLLMKLSEEKLVEVTGSSGLGGHNKMYRLASSGYKRAEEVLKVSNYVGPAPIDLDEYIEAVNRYKTLDFTEEELKNAYKDLVLTPEAMEQMGPAVLSGKSMFIYGPPGTGKTSIAERITRCYGDTIMVPFAVSIQGAPVRFFDFFLHQAVDPNIIPGVYPPIDANKDARWIEIKRPCIVVGTEFTIASSDLQYDPTGPSYQFPATIKANGGVFLVDDLGRQKENPEIILNRWIVPLEKERDILNLPTGQQISIPFKVFTVFSTNLDPKQLVDDAFLRRLAYKIKVDYPSLETYCQIFANEADKANVSWSDELLDYFIQTTYFKASRPLRACDPRDVLAKVVDKCRFKRLKKPYKLTKELIDYACHFYFVTY